MNKSDTQKLNLKTAVQAVIYIACALLTLYYCFVLWRGLEPAVGIEYRMYYITHELAVWPGFGNLTYKYGTEELCITRTEDTIDNTDGVICARIGQGFKDAAMDGITSSGTDAYMYYLPESDAATAVLKLNIKKFSGTQTDVYVEDTYVGSFSEAGRHTFLIEEVKGDELLTVHFQSDNSEFMLYSIELDTGVVD